LYDLELGIFFWFQLNDAFLSLFHISIFDDLRRCREFIFDQIRRILFYRTSKIVRVLSVNINYYCYAWMISIIFHYVSWQFFEIARLGWVSIAVIFNWELFCGIVLKSIATVRELFASVQLLFNSIAIRKKYNSFCLIVFTEFNISWLYFNSNNQYILI